MYLYMAPQSNLMKLKMVDFWGGGAIYICMQLEKVLN